MVSSSAPGCWSCIRCSKQSKRAITLLFLGVDNAGKSTTLAALQKESTDGIAPTVGFSLGNFNLKGCKINVYDLGGGSRIRGIWKNYYAEVHGIVYVVDAFDVSKLDESRDVLAGLVQDPRVKGKPLLLLANKNDLEGSLDEIDICNRLQLEENVRKYCPCQVEQCSALQTQFDKSITKGLHWLLSTIGKKFEILSDRVKVDVAEQRELELKQKRERAERVAQYRRERERQQEEEEKQESTETAPQNGHANMSGRSDESSEDDVQTSQQNSTINSPDVESTAETTESSEKPNKKKRIKGNKVGIAPSKLSPRPNQRQTVLPPVRGPPLWTRGPQERNKHVFLRSPYNS